MRQLDGNWEQDLYTTVLNTSEEDTIDTASDIDEEERPEVPPVPINECLHLIARLKNTARELGDEILLDLFNSAECGIEKVMIYKKGCQSNKQQWTTFFLKNNV
jgi:hypothetical protein